MLSLREHTDNDGKTQQISNSVFPEFSDLYLVFKKVVPFLGYCQPLGVRRGTPKSCKRTLSHKKIKLCEVGIISPKGQFLSKVE